MPTWPLRADTAEPPEAVAAEISEHGRGIDPARLGMTEERLRELFGDALRETAVERPRTLFEQIRDRSKPQADVDAGAGVGADAETAGAPDGDPKRFAEQIRLTRSVNRGGIAAAEYELFRGDLYRIRWVLADRFERPIMDAVVGAATERLGPPSYDQVLKAKLASPKAELRRTGWTRGDRTLEVRQLHPLHGGPLYVSVTDAASARRIIEAKATPMPEPDAAIPWRVRERTTHEPLTSAERRALVDEFVALLAEADFPDPE